MKLNYVGVAVVALGLAGLVYAVFVLVANSGLFLRIAIPRRFSLRTLLVITTLVALATGIAMWASP